MSPFRPEGTMLGGYLPLDGTMEFYGRVRAVLKSTDCVLDLGAGRASWVEYDESFVRRSVRDLRTAVNRLIGADIDPVVLENRVTTDNILIENGHIPEPDASIDVIVADFVLEHVVEPHAFAAEIKRVLKPGGYFCARTPSKYHYVSMGARLIKNSSHSSLLRIIQPGRKSIDVFPTAYRMNTFSEIKRYFPEWDDYSYLYCAEPSYYFGSAKIFRALSLLQRLLPEVMVSNLFVFLRRPMAAT